METRKLKLALSAGALALSLALAGCGGGGSAQAPADPPPPTPYETAMGAIEMAETAADAQAAYDAVKDDVTAAQGDRLQMAVDDRIDEIEMAGRASMQQQALMDAAGMIDTSDLSTQEAVDNARTAIAGLRGALDMAMDVSDSDKAMYQTRLDNAVAAVDAAQDGLHTDERRMNQMAALSGASDTLQAALAALSGSTPTQAQLDAANGALTALNGAITAGADLTDDEKAPYQRESDNAAAPIRTAQTAFDDAEDEADEEMREKMAADGKALHGALGMMPLGNLNRSTNAGGAALAAAGLTVDPTQGSLSADPAEVVLEAGDMAGALGDWSGMNYAQMAAKVANTAVVYTNQAAPKSVPFSEGGHTLTNGSLTVADANLGLVMAEAFMHSGIQTHAVPDKSNGVYVRGTYDGAPGEYNCTTGCSSTSDGSGSPSALGGTWTFTPDKGAMVSQPDANYLYFGWWLRKDDGDPTSASAFFGEVGDVEGDGTLSDPSAVAVNGGSATYSGHAAGKFAINNPLGGSDAGHFTADVMLTAKLGANAGTNNGGVSGMIDNFMANDQSVPWSVKLNHAWWGTSGAFGGRTIDQDLDATGTQFANTVWSIDGNAAPASGSWNGQMYDEAASGDADDGSTIPTAAMGVFESMFGSTHSMVGAFGATKQ